MSALNNALRKLNSAVKDLSTVDVLTFTGQINNFLVDTPVSDPDNPGQTKTVRRIDWARFDDLEGATTGQITLVAATRISADYDTVNFRADDAGQQTDALFKLHRESIEAALNGRARMIQLFVDTITSTS